MNISFIIVNYNTGDVLLECVESLRANKSLEKFAFEIVIVDNNSTKVEKEKLSRLFGNENEIQLLFLDDNYGFGYANNRGSEAAQSDIVCFINSDVTVVDTDFDLLMEEVRKENSGIVSSVILNSDGSLQSAGFSSPTLLGEINQNIFFKNFNFRKKRIRLPKTGKREVGWISGAFFLCKRKDYIEIGGFDEQIFMYSEDVDLSLQFKENSKQNIVCLATHIYHNQTKKEYHERLKTILLDRRKNYYYVLKKHAIFSERELVFVKLLNTFNIYAIVLQKFIKNRLMGK